MFGRRSLYIFFGHANPTRKTQPVDNSAFAVDNLWITIGTLIAYYYITPIHAHHTTIAPKHYGSLGIHAIV